MESLLAELERVEKERKKLCERYAEKDADGRPVMAGSVVDGKKTREYKMGPEGLKTVNEEYQALLDTEVDICISTVDGECIRQCEENEQVSHPGKAGVILMRQGIKYLWRMKNISGNSWTA